MNRHAAGTAGTRWMIGVMAASLLAAAAQPASAQSREREVAREILVGARQVALDQMLRASRAESPMLRANAMEAAQWVPGSAQPMLQLGLEDPNPGVRFVALVGVGRLKLKGLGEVAREMVDDPSPSIRAAALFAARACGLDVDLSPMAEMLAAPDPVLRGNVAMLLGILGDPSAIRVLRDRTRKPMRRASNVDQAIVAAQVEEAIVKLGDDTAIGPLRARAYSTFDEVRVLAVKMLGRLEDRQMTSAIANLLDQPPVELQLAAAEALARLDGDPSGLPIMLQSAQSPRETLRVQAAFALGQLPARASAEALVKMLEDPSPRVRIAAAAAVLEAIADLTGNGSGAR